MNPNILGLMKYIDAKNEINPLINTSAMIYKITLNVLFFSLNNLKPICSSESNIFSR